MFTRKLVNGPVFGVELVIPGEGGRSQGALGQTDSRSRRNVSNGQCAMYSRHINVILNIESILCGLLPTPAPICSGSRGEVLLGYGPKYYVTAPKRSLLLCGAAWWGSAVRAPVLTVKLWNQARDRVPGVIVLRPRVWIYRGTSEAGDRTCVAFIKIRMMSLLRAYCRFPGVDM